MEILNEKSDIKVNMVTIYNREKMEILGASEVLSSTQNEVIARVCDSLMIITGTELRVSKFVPEDKVLGIVGTVNAVKYENKVSKKSFLGKVFK